MRRLLLVAAVAVTLPPGPALAGTGSFSTSDPLLDTLWAESARTADMMLAEPTNLAPGLCSYPVGHTIILDGYVRDRCSWIGDLAVTGKTLLLTGQGDPRDIRFALETFAATQRDDGSICPVIGPLCERGVGVDGAPCPLNGPPCEPLTLVDYQAYWIEVLRDYVLYTGDRDAARALLGTVERILDRYYASDTLDGLFQNNRAIPGDYASINRRSRIVAYYNAQYVLVLQEGAQLARWAGRPDRAAAWEASAQTVAARVQSVFWDAAAGAFKDTPDAEVVHPQDGNAFAVLAAIGTPAEQRSALDYLSAHNAYDYGNSIVDDGRVWSGWPWGIQAERRVYPFMTFFEVMARFKLGLDTSAVELIRRLWGFMARKGPGTMWEVVGPYGTPNLFPAASLAHGWSSGVVPALTTQVLGLQPDGPGFARFIARPRPAGLTWARGDVPTPHGTIHFEWRRQKGSMTAKVSSPVAGTVVLPTAGNVTVDGKPVKLPAGRSETMLAIRQGTHEIAIAAPEARPHS
jgi:hypothetical protein